MDDSLSVIKKMIAKWQADVDRLKKGADESTEYYPEHKASWVNMYA